MESSLLHINILKCIIKFSETRKSDAGIHTIKAILYIQDYTQRQLYIRARRDYRSACFRHYCWLINWWPFPSTVCKDPLQMHASIFERVSLNENSEQWKHKLCCNSGLCITEKCWSPLYIRVNNLNVCHVECGYCLCQVYARLHDIFHALLNEVQFPARRKIPSNICTQLYVTMLLKIPIITDWSPAMSHHACMQCRRWCIT